MADAPPDPDETAAIDPQEAAYRTLHAERSLLEQALTRARQEQQFSSDTAAIEQARLREESLLKDLDRVLTMIRAAEVRRRDGPVMRRWQ